MRLLLLLLSIIIGAVRRTEPITPKYVQFAKPDINYYV